MIHKPTPRRGAATLELVFAFPFLLTICAVMVFLGRGVMMKTGAATEARREAFEKKATARSGEVLAWVGRDPLDGVVRADVPATLKTNQLLGNFDIEERAAVTGDTWDEAAVPMGEIGIPFTPHVGALLLITTNGKAGGNLGGSNAITSGLGSLESATAMFVTISRPLCMVIEFMLSFVDVLMPVLHTIADALPILGMGSPAQLRIITQGMEGLTVLRGARP
jgi:hypothetical protein